MLGKVRLGDQGTRSHCRDCSEMKIALVTFGLWAFLCVLALGVVTLSGPVMVERVHECGRALDLTFGCEVVSFSARYWWMLVLPFLLIVFATARFVAVRLVPGRP